MTVEERTIGDVTILDVKGRLTVDAPGEVRLADTVGSLVSHGRKRIILNLAAVSQVDSSGLCDVATASTAAVRDGGELKLLNPTARVRDLLVVTKLLTVLEAYDSEEAAVASFPRPSA